MDTAAQTLVARNDDEEFPLQGFVGRGSLEDFYKTNSNQ
jgi:hypothetical protein